MMQNRLDEHDPIMESVTQEIAKEIRLMEDAKFAQIVANITGHIGKHTASFVGHSGYRGSINSYTEAALRAMLGQYFIQILNSEEGDILDMNEHIYKCLIEQLQCLYHPIYRPINEPIKAVKEIIEDDKEFTLIMIRVQ
jgi:hypothetical protein